MTDVMRERGSVVNSAAQMLASGDVNLDTLPGLILRIINEDMWRQRAIPQHQWQLSPEFRSFEEFVTTGPLDGLGTSVQSLRDLCRRRTEAIDAIDRACQRETGYLGHSSVDNIHTISRPSGTAQTAALRRLRKDRPDLHRQVLDGEKSAHAAAVEAGYRHRTVSVRVTDPPSAARTLIRHMEPDDLAELVRLLS